ncbi:MAG: superoxide dismutase [Bacteroidales bacterium]|nr:superoxide dismutase [Bacteroidales bacterium]MBR6423120.1 superoxide dismutase [Bacteroidales bacterium]
MFKLIDLPYKSLAPVISDQTLAFHHGKHLQTYVDNLNKLLPGSGLEDLPLEEIVRHSGLDPESRGVFNNAGQILNHELYFTQFASQPSCPAPTGHLKAQIEKQWSTIEAFKQDFESKGVTLFGSGWVWLQANETGELSIAQYGNADNPVAHGLKPLLTFDVWEHAYYLDYQNRRAAHLSALWQIVNWAEIEKRYK